MFQSARVKLTGWYLLILMMVSGLFSVIIYNGVSQEIDRTVALQRSRYEAEQHLPFRLQLPQTDPEVVSEAKNRVKLNLLEINAVILTISALLSYFLAGRTLRPIETMVDEQTRFVSDASHELRTPLTALKTSLEVNLRDDKTTKTDQTLLGSYLEKVNSLHALTDDLLYLAQHDKAQVNYVFEKVSVKKIVDDAFQKVKIMATEKKIGFQFEHLSIDVVGDKQKLASLFTILFDNAIKYSAENTSVSVTAHKRDGSVYIRVKDHGSGIEEADIPHLFDRFYRSDKSRSVSRTGGYGLGLAIAARVAADHGGSVSVKSELGRGSTFTVALPVKWG